MKHPGIIVHVYRERQTNSSTPHYGFCANGEKQLPLIFQGQNKAACRPRLEESNQYVL